MDSIERYLNAALEIGFSCAAEIDGSDIKCQPEFRAYCNPEQCKVYGTNWVCPPGCGTLEECAKRAEKYKMGIIMQSVTGLPSKYKTTVIQNCKQKHNTRLLQLAVRARKEIGDVLPLSTGGCIICEKCAYPDPCRYPDIRMSALSAFGINVSELCQKAGLEYAFREDKLYFTACLLF